MKRFLLLLLLASFVSCSEGTGGSTVSMDDGDDTEKTNETSGGGLSDLIEDVEKSESETLTSNDTQSSIQITADHSAGYVIDFEVDGNMLSELDENTITYFVNDTAIIVIEANPDRGYLYAKGDLVNDEVVYDTVMAFEYAFDKTTGMLLSHARIWASASTEKVSYGGLITEYQNIGTYEHVYSAKSYKLDDAEFEEYNFSDGEITLSGETYNFDDDVVLVYDDNGVSFVAHDKLNTLFKKSIFFQFNRDEKGNLESYSRCQYGSSSSDENSDREEYSINSDDFSVKAPFKNIIETLMVLDFKFVARGTSKYSLYVIQD